MPEYLLKQQGKSCSDGAFSVRCQWKSDCKPTVLLLDLLNANITRSLELCAFALSLGCQQKIILFYHHSLTSPSTTPHSKYLSWNDSEHIDLLSCRKTRTYIFNLIQKLKDGKEYAKNDHNLLPFWCHGYYIYYIYLAIHISYWIFEISVATESHKSFDYLICHLPAHFRFRSAMNAPFCLILVKKRMAEKLCYVTKLPYENFSWNNSTQFLTKQMLITAKRCKIWKK